MDNFSFYDLRVYKESKSLVKEIYRLMDKFPKYEMYALSDQLRRSVTSIPSNIAEGSGRVSFKEKIHFVEIAYGSLMESLCQMDLAQDLGYITHDEFLSIEKQVTVVGKQLSGLKASYLRSLNTSHPANR